MRFHARVLNAGSKGWTHCYATSIRPDLNLNFVLRVADEKALQQDSLRQVGIGVAGRQADKPANALPVLLVPGTATVAM